MAASLWVRVLGSFCQPGHPTDGVGDGKGRRFRHTCPNCKVKLSKSNPLVYSVGEYVRGRRRNVVNHVCRNCWVDTCRRSMIHVNAPIQTQHCQRPHWMDLPWVEPRLTPEETWLLNELCWFDVMPSFFEVVASQYSFDPKEPGPFITCQFVQTVERQFDADEMRCHPVRDWCEDHGVAIEETRYGRWVFPNVGISFLLPRRDGQPHHVPHHLVCPGC